MAQHIKIKLTSRRTELGGQLIRSLFDTMLPEDEAEDIDGIDGIDGTDAADGDGQGGSRVARSLRRLFAEIDAEEDVIEMITEGTLSLTDGRIVVAYDESELTGMEGARTEVSFAIDNPNLITMMRGGTVSTALVFEPGKRHICAYHTPFMPFEICVLTHRIFNDLVGSGTLHLDYLIELRGAQAERTKFTMEIRTLTEEEPLERPEVMFKT